MRELITSNTSLHVFRKSKEWVTLVANSSIVNVHNLAVWNVGRLASELAVENPVRPANSTLRRVNAFKTVGNNGT